MKREFKKRQERNLKTLKELLDNGNKKEAVSKVDDEGITMNTKKPRRTQSADNKLNLLCVRCVYLVSLVLLITF